MNPRMKKIFQLICFVAVVALFAAACKQEQLETYPYGSELSFASFSPNPIYRGGELTIIGSHLEDVSQVLIPGIDPITDIRVLETGEKSRIAVTLPNTTEEVGKISIVGKDGRVLTSLAELTYTEPIVFDDFSPKSAMPGDVITVTGDYMNLIQEVIFADGVIASGDAILSRTRKSLTVVVPAHAVTGLIILGDADEVADPDNVANKSYSEVELTIGDPTVSSLEIETVKPGQTVTISGVHLEMIEKVSFAGDVVVTDFTVSEDGKTITLALPAAAQSGDVVATSFAGKEFNAGAIEAIVPTELSAAPAPVKAGAELKISGKDLDLVTAVNLPGADGTSFGLLDGEIVLTVPAKAQEGDITLDMANGSQVSVAYTLVHPTVTGISPVELMAGETFEITGTDLDLVTAATLGGKPVEIEASEEKITVTTANTSVSGKVVLSLANGEKVEPSETITLSYDSFIVVNEMPSAEHIGATVTLKGENFMMIENIYIGEVKVSQYITRSDNEISFIMPFNKVGTYSMYFDLLSGDRETCPQSIEVLLEVKYITAWEGEVPLSWGAGGQIQVPAVKFLDVKPGAKLRLYYSQIDQVWGQIQFNYGDWSGINFDGEGGTTFEQTLVPTNIYGWFSDGILDRCTEVVLTKTILDNIQARVGTYGDITGVGMEIQGENEIFRKVEIVQEIPQEKTVWEGSLETGDYGTNLEIGTEDDWINAELKEGDEVRVYFTPADPADWSMQFFDGHWNAMNMFFPGEEKPNQFNQTRNPDAAANGFLAFTVTPEIYTAFTTKANWGFAIILQGKNLTITRIAFL